MTDSFTQRNSARKDDRLPTEKYESGGAEYHLPQLSLVPPGYTIQLSYNVDDLLEYVGTAQPGVATSAASWQIRKFTYTGTKLTSVKWADGDRLFDNIWDNRASLSYS